jgi:hypothetical protein
MESGYIETGFNYNLFAGFFVWNQWSRDWLIRQRNIEPNRVYSTGSIRNSIVVKRKNFKFNQEIGDGGSAGNINKFFPQNFSRFKPF